MGTFTIVMFPKIQVDTVIAYFLLKEFGEAKFPGITQAPVAFWSELPADKSPYDLEREGYILIDLGNGAFDHHRLGPDNKKISASHLVAQYLEIEDKPELQKLLELARRDDLEGKGTLSNDPIDRAFGFSALLTNLNKAIPDHSSDILNLVLPLIRAHYVEEYRRFEQYPKELEALTQAGKVKTFTATQLGKQLKVFYIESDNPAIASFLRSRAVGADLVIQKASTGHVNFITKQALRLQLHKLSRHVKLLEAQKNNITLPLDSMQDLEKPGRTDALPHWYYDTRANTLQNGGVNPQGIPPTKLSYEEIELATKQGLNVPREQGRTDDRNRHGFGKGSKVTRQHGAIIIE